jgi:geranylgeranyl pyrophosphate synthase
LNKVFLKKSFMKINFEEYLQDRRERVNVVLDNYLPAVDLEPAKLHSAMRYGVLEGGKRIRPLLVYATGEMLGVAPEILDLPACCVELIHASSLIHDDLPAMDNDTVRRGKPTCHKAFGEAVAILAGDSLPALAFELIAKADDAILNPKTRVKMIEILASTYGSEGMIAGQLIDLNAISNSPSILSMFENNDKQEMDLPRLEKMYALKTGALMSASVQLGALCANNFQSELLDQFAKDIGLAFQIQDDILDAGSIADENKITYVSLVGMDNAQLKVRELYEHALASLEKLSCDSNLLVLLAGYVMWRIKNK